MKGKLAVWIVAAAAVAVTAGLLMSWLLYPTSIGSATVEVPQLRGTNASQAVTDLAAIGLRGRLAGELADPFTAAGNVSWQSPAAGTFLPESSVVQIGVSTGTPRVLVPELADLDVAAATRVLIAAGLKAGTIETTSDAAEPGVILGSRPDARQPIRAGSAVDLIVSSGPRSRP